MITLTDERLEAHQMLFSGQSNVRQIADKFGCSYESLLQSFRAYVKDNKIVGDEWQKDVELSWPFV